MRRTLTLGAAKRAVAPMQESVLAKMRPSFVAPPATWGLRPISRPFSVLGATSWSRIPEQKAAAAAAMKEAPQALAAPIAAAPASESAEAAGGALEAISSESGKALESIRRKGMIFEIGITFTFLHYQSIFIYFSRGLFQAVRPLLTP